MQYAFRMEPRDYQLENFERFKDKPVCAIFSDPGTGKTKTALDIVSYRWHKGLITGVLVFSSPKGVHAQWVEEQVPLHLWENVPVAALYWKGSNGKLPLWFGLKPDVEELQIFSTNIDSLNSDKAYTVLESFCHAHRGKLLIIVDESDSIKSFSAKRSKKLRLLAFNAQCSQRMIMTGTPIAKDLTDEWAQFYFLDRDIIGHKYKTTFQAQFCIMGGFENRHVVGHRNVDLFKQLTKPHIFRASKEQLHLPPKIYDTVQFELSDEQLRLIKEIRDTCIGVLDHEQDMRVLASTAATAILRMQQISCGFARVGDSEDEPETVELAKNPRTEALFELLDQMPDRKVIIWCRFRQDVRNIKGLLGADAVTIFGDDLAGDRYLSKTRFIEDPDVQYLVATPDAAGKGMDGLQNACSTAIYYSNSYNAILRWQSEDRIHRIGQKTTASYFDLIARGSPDKAILKNLRAKKDLSTLVLDDLRRIIEGKDE
jgi:SNF2 family DNA or RNA helicase